LSALDKDYSDLMRELWGSPERWNVRKSYVDVARKLGVDEETVRNRLNRVRQSGFLVGWRLVPNSSLFGRKPVMQHLTFESPQAKAEALLLLGRMDGVITAASLYGAEVLVTLFDDQERTLSRALSALGAKDGPVEWQGMGIPSSAFHMTPTDWQIVRLMLRDAERAVTEVAALVKTSARTAKRRLDKMMDAAAIFIMPIVDQARSSGISYQVVVESEPGKKSEVDRLVTSRIENLVFRATDSSDTLIFGFPGKNVAEGKELLGWLRRQPGVRSARINIVEEVVYAFEWLERESARLASAK
jgi:DNA-binding Lrp family transcriptional regulator